MIRPCLSRRGLFLPVPLVPNYVVCGMNFSNANLVKLSLHFVGNPSTDDRFIPGTEMDELADELKEKLLPYYLHKFSTIPERYKFHHASALKFNEVYSFASSIFEDPSQFDELSREIAGHLFEKSVHPNIKAGELHIVYFTDCGYNNKMTEAIGIFKTENKAGFLEVTQSKTSLGMKYKEGIDVNKIEKGCLIFNTAQRTGFEVLVIDKQSTREEAKYWVDEFLGLLQISNEFSQTNEILSLAKNYITNQLSEDFEASRTDKIDLLNRSIDYFKTHETFEKAEFEKEVFHHPEMIRSFRQFDSQYRQEKEVDIEDSFSISEQAVKKQSRIFKSVLKLDKNFHIYIHGNKDMIERGVDPNGRKYYKIYYENEN